MIFSNMLHLRVTHISLKPRWFFKNSFFSLFFRLHNHYWSFFYYLLLTQIYCWAPLVSFSFQLLYFSILEFPFDSFLIIPIYGHSLFAVTFSPYLFYSLITGFLSFFEHICNSYFEDFVKFDIWLLSQAVPGLFFSPSGWVVLSCFLAWLIFFLLKTGHFR